MSSVKSMLLLFALSLSFKRINSSWIKRNKKKKNKKKHTHTHTHKKKHFVSLVSTWTKVSVAWKHFMCCFALAETVALSVFVISAEGTFSPCYRYRESALLMLSKTPDLFFSKFSSSAKKWDIWREKGYLWNGHEDLIGLPPLLQIRQPNSLEQLFHHLLPMRHLSKHCFHYLQLYFCHICETGN